MNTISKEIINDLKRDNIVIREPNRTIYNYLDNRIKEPLIKHILSTRYDNLDMIKKYKELTLRKILSRSFISKLADIDKASELINNHIKQNHRILFYTDMDVDGVTSAVIAYLFMTQVYKYDNIEILINKKSRGYGVNDVSTEEIINKHKEQPFQLLITADHGSHDRDNLNKIKETLNIDIIVTDHHLFEENTRPIVDAFVNPQRDDNGNISKDITGATVLFFTLVKSILDKYDVETVTDIPDQQIVNYIFYLLTYVGMTVISDCMDLSDPVNRRLVNKALRILNSANIKHNVFWKTMLDYLGNPIYIDEQTLGFNIIPLLNTPGRLYDAKLSFDLMTSRNEEKALELLGEILNLNNERKERQLKIFNEENIEYKSDNLLVMITKSGRNVEGIAANMILNNSNYKVVIVLTPNPKDPNMLNGSARMTLGKGNLKELFDIINQKHDLFISYGGHAKAVGIAIKNNPELLFKELDKLLKEYELEEQEEILVDDYIYSNKKLIISLFDMDNVKPYGIGFEKPLFVSDATLVAYRLVEKKGNYYLSGKIRLSDQSDFVIGFFYPVPKIEIEELREKIKYTKKVRLVYTPNVNSYMNTNKVQLLVNKLILK